MGKFATPAMALIAATGAAGFVLPRPNSRPARSEVALASYLDDLGVASAPLQSLTTSNPEASDDQFDDLREPISASPSFEEYMEQQGQRERTRSTIVNRSSNFNGYLDNLSGSREVVEERREAVFVDETVVIEEKRQVVEASGGGGKRGGYTAPPSSALGDFLVQRAIQQQLYYHAQLGNEPMLDWLKRFRSHEHLDSFERGEGRNGMPGTYSATFDQLKTLPFTSYLEALGTEPDSSIEVSFVKPQRRLSARERANPYLNNQPPVVEIYDQPIITSKILSQLLNTADALVETWAFHFTEAEKNDLIRVASDRAEMMAMPSTMMLEWRALEKGGETAYSRLTGDEAMPLYGFDCRACDRFDTLRALSLLVDEVTALTPETVFNVAYIRREVPEDDVLLDDGSSISELLLKRRRARRAKFEEGFVTGDDTAKGEAARAAALSFLHKFCNEWVPKLVKGDARSSLTKGEYRHAPGMKELRPEDAGSDSEEAFEELWDYADEGIQKMRGGELVLPGLMGQRLREIRAAVAAESRGTLLELVAPELMKARLEYTDYVQEDGDGMGAYERLNHQAQVDGSEGNDTYSTAAIIAEMSIDM